MNTTTDGIETTYPSCYSPGIARFQCLECGAWSRSDERGGRIRHGRRCDTQPQPVAVQTAETERQQVVARRTELDTFASHVRRTGMTQGRDQDVLDAVRSGYLSVSDAMNTDD